MNGRPPLPASATLFEPLALRSVSLRNRIVLSPMAQYSAEDGMANDWHFVHYASRAAGGLGAVVVEVTAVSPEGRICPGELGLWRDEQVAPLARLAALIAAQGAVPGIQIGHAGRKACTARAGSRRSRQLSRQNGRGDRANRPGHNRGRGPEAPPGRRVPDRGGPDRRSRS